ncbi:S8 family peptidase [Paludifilum halophilum]|nr:S8 family peptidase [Paludifilum halophilum]
MKPFRWISAFFVLLLAVSALFPNGNGQASAPEEVERDYNPRVVIKFKDATNLPYRSGAEKHLSRSSAQAFTEAVSLEPLFSSVNPEAIQSLMSQASKKRSDHPKPDLLSYFVTEVPPDVQPEKWAKKLTRQSAVELAYVEGGPTPPSSVHPDDDPRFGNQGYLAPSPQGIDVQSAWGFKGGDGSGIGFVDLEQGWRLEHEDLADQNIRLISGVNHMFHSHGTSVLGEVAAADNTIGNIGITPRAKTRVVSQWRTPSTYSTADAVLSAVNAMEPGDVLLLEAQTTVGESGYLPVEVEPAVFDAIRAGTSKGVIVVEAGGNGSNNLDQFTDAEDKNVLNRNSPDFKDSGAIMVGAASSAAPHSRLPFSNYGSRVDVYAWGENIDTLSADGYTTSFGGTSGASPIITGTAIALQGISEENRGKRYSPEEMRQILSNPETGIASNAPASDKIGVMPDLDAILSQLYQ